MKYNYPQGIHFVTNLLQWSSSFLYPGRRLKICWACPRNWTGQFWQTMKTERKFTKSNLLFISLSKELLLFKKCLHVGRISNPSFGDDKQSKDKIEFDYLFLKQQDITRRIDCTAMRQWDMSTCHRSPSTETDLLQFECRETPQISVETNQHYRDNNAKIWRTTWVGRKEGRADKMSFSLWYSQQ